MEPVDPLDNACYSSALGAVMEKSVDTRHKAGQCGYAVFYLSFGLGYEKVA